MIKVIGRRDILDIVSMFLIVQFAGVTIASLVVYTSTISLIQNGITSQYTTLLSYILDAILIVTVSFLFISRHSHHHKALEDSIFFGVLEAVVVIATSFFFFLYIFDLLLPRQYIPVAFFGALGCALLLIAAKDIDPKIRNSVTIISSMGVGLLLGLYFKFEYALIGLAIVAAYDYISVFVTKSMIKLARVVTTRNMALIISTAHLEAVPQERFPAKEVREYKDYLYQTHKAKDPAYWMILSSGRLPVMSQISLGEGDLGLPLMAAVSAYYTFASPVIAIMVIMGALAGLLAAIAMLRVYRGALPAIPPLFAFISIFSGFGLAITGNISSYYSVLLVAAGVAMITFGLSIKIVEKRSRKPAQVRHAAYRAQGGAHR